MKHAVIAGPLQTPQPLPVEQLYRKTDPSSLAFATTAELEPIDGLVGQDRALEAIRFGTEVERPGFNLFVIGPNGARMQAAVKAVLAERRPPGRAPRTGFTSTISPSPTSQSPLNFPRAGRGHFRRRCTS